MRKLTLQEFQKSSYLAGNDVGYLEALYEQFLQDPASIDVEWRDYFNTLFQGAPGAEVSHKKIREQFVELSKRPAFMSSMVVETASQTKQVAVDEMIEAFRRFGHLNAKINPLGDIPVGDPRLQLSYYNLDEADLKAKFATQGLLEKSEAPLSEIYQRLNDIYCRTVGVEYSTISNEHERHWLRDYVEKRLPNTNFDASTQRNILKQLIHSEFLEKYLDSKYVGQKRFSIEGGDSLIPLLDELACRARMEGIQEIVIGMAHRGRLNVLLNIMGQCPAKLFEEFEGKHEYGMTSGDVKYHRGYSRDVKTDSGSVHLALAFNPSHLEFICPVIMGSVRARQHRQGENQIDYALGVMIHGDASFAGQGVVMETLNMSQTRAHCVGGVLHIILNNQIGFTVSDPKDARSSHYCSDLAKMLDAPIFHINGDDPEAVVAVTQLALDYRMTFHKDVFIDLVCYRRHGHQEMDEPVATQPVMYQIIKQHATTQKIYADKLVERGVCTADEVEKWKNDYRARLDVGSQIVETLSESVSEHHAANWTPYVNQVWSTFVDSSVPMERLKQLGQRIDHYPSDFKLQRQVNAIMQARKKMTAGEQAMDWGYGETMAYATLLDEGYPVRLVGEDSRRGTFFHRHAAIFDMPTGKEYMPLRHLNDHQAKVEIYDSLLSECGALGFEYGYSTAHPKSLVLWEAQFGDFANGAQVIIDQFISSGWQKWNRLSGLVLLLPHGYEGMGPEHSSARLERYLQLCAQYNIQVCVPTTPSQMFHLLRRQVLRPFRKPLVIMTPKSLLRHKLATSHLDELAKGHFRLVIGEVDEVDAAAIKRVVLCSGKVYYDLLMKRREEKLNHIAIIRIEQLYPFPYDQLKRIMEHYPQATEVVWCQEEPKNQGAWFNTRHRLLQCLLEGQTLSYVGRKASAAPAAGYPALHRQQQNELILQGLNLMS